MGSTAIPNNRIPRLGKKALCSSTPILPFFDPRAFKASILTQTLHRAPEVNNDEKDPVSRHVLFFDAPELLTASGNRERPRALLLTRQLQGENHSFGSTATIDHGRLRFCKGAEFIHFHCSERLRTFGPSATEYRTEKIISASFEANKISLVVLFGLGTKSFVPDG